MDYAIRYYSDQIKYAERVNNFHAVADSRNYHAQIYVEKGNYILALDYLAKAMSRAGPVEKFKVLITRAELEAATKDKVMSCKSLQEAKDLYIEIEANIGPDTQKRIIKLDCGIDFSQSVAR